MIEEWKKIADDRLPDYYEISNYGGLRSLPYVDARGWRRKLYYFRYTNAEVSLTCVDGRCKSFPIAALVLKTFVGPPGKGQYLARHLDDNRKNNYVENLAWGNDADNNLDARRNGRSFASYGHQGHPHSLKTKQKLSKMKLGKPTGRKMTPEHKEAITAGYRKKFPEKILTQTLCACGCNVLARAGSKFIWGHSGRLRFKKIAKERIGKSRQW